MRKPEDVSFKVVWSQEDDAFVARVAEFPSLAAHGDSEDAALREIRRVVEFVEEDLIRDEPVV